MCLFSLVIVCYRLGNYYELFFVEENNFLKFGLYFEFC